MSKIRQRSKNLIYSGLAGAAIVGIIFAGYVIYNIRDTNKQQLNLRLEYEQKVQVMKDEQDKQEQSMVSGYVTSNDIAAGQMIQQKDLVAVKLPPMASPENLIANNEDIVGSSSKIELRKGTPLTKAMFFEGAVTSPDLRNREINVINLPTNLKIDEVVDVRIQFPTGQDYIVLSKKKIDNLLSPTLWIRLNEQEILTFSSAMVDAYLHKATLYALTYVEPQMQDEAIPTYPINKEVQKLIAKDPNIVNKAELHLSESIRLSLEADLERMSLVTGTGTIETMNNYASNSSKVPTTLEMNEENTTITNTDNEMKNDILAQNSPAEETFSDTQDNPLP